MKVDYINPVLIASSKIIKVLIQEDITLGRLSLLDAHDLVNSLAIIMWMNGDFEGRFLFAIKRNTAISIASMIMGEDITELKLAGIQFHQVFGDCLQLHFHYLLIVGLADKIKDYKVLPEAVANLRTVEFGIEKVIYFFLNLAFHVLITIRFLEILRKAWLI